ncbi:10146_t:CDS:2, partial [Scutellospora calospora]
SVDEVMFIPQKQRNKTRRRHHQNNERNTAKKTKKDTKMAKKTSPKRRKHKETPPKRRRKHNKNDEGSTTKIRGKSLTIKNKQGSKIMWTIMSERSRVNGIVLLLFMMTLLGFLSIFLKKFSIIKEKDTYKEDNNSGSSSDKITSLSERDERDRLKKTVLSYNTGVSGLENVVMNFRAKFEDKFNLTWS